jgi:Carboxypeptidase regulatory-like domain/TonB dependent receptor
MFNKVMLPIACFLLFVLYTVGYAHGQQTTATLVGTVVDPSRAVIPHATVTATHVVTNQTFTTVTTSSGDYALPSLPDGQYVVTGGAEGFSKLSKNGIVLNVGQTVRIDFNLAVGATTQVAQINAQAPLLETSSPTMDQVMSPQMVEALPLNSRDITALATLAPGVLPVRGYEAGWEAQFIVRGLRRGSNNVYLNGALITQGNGATTFLPNIDALQEFQLNTSLYGAQYGIMDGGQLVVATKSGGNRIHGDAFEYLRNNNIAAANFFQPQKPSYNRNDFGGTFGGPIYIPKLFDGRDKAWFFLSLERVITQQFSALSGTVPTDGEKQGVFPTAIIDPMTGQDFPNNTIPANRISPVAQQFLQFFPEPNTPGSVNFFSPNSTANSTTGQIMTKVDYQQTPNVRWWGQFVHDSTPEVESAVIQRFAVTQPLSTVVASVGRADTFGGKYVNSISLNDFRRPYITSISPEANCTFAPGLGIPQLLTTGIDTCGVPSVGIQGYVALGDFSSSGTNLVGTWWLPEEFSFQKGKHFLEAGFDWRRQFDFAVGGKRSSLSFTNLYSGNAFANFLLGLPTTTTLGAESSRANLAMNSFFYWLQDTWRVTPRLTLDLGLRFEDRMPMKDKRGWSANFDTQTGILYPALQDEVLQPGQQGKFIAGVPLITYSPLQGFLPRIGFAYNATRNTVIRGGYSLYAAEPIISEYGNLSTNPRPGAQQLVYTNGVTTPIFTLADPFPSGLAGQAIPSAGGVASPFKLQRTHEWGLSFQLALAQDWTFDIGYDGSRTQNQIEEISLNDAPPGPGAIQARRPYADFSSILYTASDAGGSYNALDTRLQKQPGKDGLTLLVGFSWSKAIDSSDDIAGILGEDSTRSVNMPLSLNRGLSSGNIGLRFVTSLDYQLPFGRGRTFATDGLASRFAGGWSVQTITSVQSGPWFTVYLPGDPLNTGDTNSEWPDRICNPNLPHSQRTRQVWFNTNCFVTPPPFTYGNAGRSSVQAPGLVNSDIAIHRLFHFSEGQSIAFRAEAFNSFNHPAFGLPGQSLGVAGFGTITSALAPRQLQLGFKYIF